MHIVAFGTLDLTIIRSYSCTSKCLIRFDIKPDNSFGQMFSGNEIKVDPVSFTARQGVKCMITVISCNVVTCILYIGEL